MSDYFLAGFVDELTKTAKAPVPVEKLLSPKVRELLMRLGVTAGGVGIAHRVMRPDEGMGGAARAGIGIGGGMVAGSQLARAMGGKGGLLPSAVGAYLGHRVMRKESSMTDVISKQWNAGLTRRAEQARLPPPPPPSPPMPGSAGTPAASTVRDPLRTGTGRGMRRVNVAQNAANLG